MPHSKNLVSWITCTLIAILLSASGITELHSQQFPKGEAPCRAFVQQFYDWYVALEAHPEKLGDARTPLDVALHLRPEFFDRELLQMLKEDSAAQAKADEIVGLDYDPFLNTNGEFGSVAKVSKATIINGRCHAVIYGYEEGDLQGRAFAELAFNGRAWVFTDFFQDGRFSRETDLLHQLRVLARDRAQTARSHP